ncbi:MAG: M6 family metalloprotease domain-containing protein, partial [Fidelibacterota bacterium]
MLAKGEIAEPYFLREFATIRARGVNAPWSAPALANQLRPEGISHARSLGPAQVLSGDYKALLILVDFSDKESQTESTFFDTLAFYESAGTLRDYYQDVSYGTLDIVTVHAPGALGWVQAPQSYAYYVDAQNGFGTYPRNAQRLLEDAVHAVDGTVDFSQYDNNGDDYVDALFIVHSGSSAAYTGSDHDIWSHSWETTSDQIMDDGGIVRKYSMGPEYYASPGDMTVGVYAHEMGHTVFGLPDLYDYGTDGTDSKGLGCWSLMAGGSWNGVDGDSPALPDAWCHFQMGYVDPIDKPDNEIGYMVAPVANSPEVCRLWIDENEYFLVENRQQLGYDAALPGEGLLIYHVDEAVRISPYQMRYANDNEWYPGYEENGHYLVALEQADGLWNLERNENSGDSGDPFPGDSGNANFHLLTTPNSESYEGDKLWEIVISNITPSGDLMIVDWRASPDIQVSDNTLSFGSMSVGASNTLILSVLNEGPWLLQISHLFSDNLQFSVDTMSFDLEPETTQDVYVTFTPIDTGFATGTLTIDSNDPDESTVTVALEGRGRLSRTFYVSADGCDIYGDGSSDNPYATIRHAFDFAFDSDTVLVQPGIYVGNINFHGKGIVLGSLFLITGDTSYISQTVIDGDRSGSVVTFENGEDSTAVLSGLTITNGKARSGGFLGDGGGIYCSNSSPVITNVDINGNTAELGGGIYLSNSSPKLVNVSVSGNWTYSEGSWSGGFAPGIGGGIYCDNSSPGLENVTVSGNRAYSSGGGGIYCDNSSPSLENVTVSGNTTWGAGGGMCCENSNPSLLNVTVSGNRGSGIHCSSSHPTLVNVTVSGNEGGGIYCDNSSPNLLNVTVSGNTTWDAGGGIYCG